MDLPVIGSRQNSTVKAAAKLLSAEVRKAERSFLAEGARLCADAAESKLKIKTAFFTEEALDKYAAYIKEILSKAAESYVIMPHVAELLSQTKHTQGVFCVCEKPEWKVEKLRGKHIVLENMQDPSNLGAVMRTTEAVGVSGIILTGDGCDLFSPKALRASMGAAFRLPVIVMDSSLALIECVRAENVKTYASIVDSAAAGIEETDFAENAVIFIGNEGSGLLKSTVDACDFRFTIPMKGRAESLNAAAAAAIIIWEIAKE